jgi:hypothetical protein
MIPGFMREVEHELRLRSLLDDSDIAQAESVLQLTQPTSPPNLHLHGETWKPLIMTGNMASEAMPDILNVLVRPVIPLASVGDVSILVGNVDAIAYNALMWSGVESPLPSPSAASPHDALMRPAAAPPLYVSPEINLDAADYTLYQLAPSMLRPETVDEYFGDDDADFAPYTLDGVAHMLGFSNDQALLAANGIMGQLVHLFTRPDPAKGWVRVVPSALRVFHSSRTRKPWTVAVRLSLQGMPTQTVAYNARTAPVIRDIEAVLFRTPDHPNVPASTEPLADDAAKRSVAALGWIA